MSGKIGMSLRAYAKLRGVTHGAVQKAIDSGRITALPDGSIDPDIANKEWEENTNISKVRAPKSNAFTDAQILKLKAEATLAQLKVKKEIGAVIATDEVILLMRILTSDLSNSFLSLGRNLAPRVIGETDILKITRLIDEEIKRLIKEYKNGLEDRITKATTAFYDSKNP